MTSKLYNQNEARGSLLIQHLQSHELTSAQTSDWIVNQGIHGLKASAQEAIVSGRNNALEGVRLINSLELGHGRLSQAWHTEIHINGNKDLSSNFNNSPDTQLFDAMMRDPSHGARILAHMDKNAPAQAATIQGADATARLEMSHINLDSKGALTVQNPNGDRFELEQKGWSKNGVPVGTLPNQPSVLTSQNAPSATTSVQADPSVAQSGNILNEGTHGHAVHDLQTSLAKVGYKDGHGHPLKADGNFGIDTRHAVERFQHDHGLAVDGIAGPRTLKALHQQGLAKAATTPLHLDHPAHPDHALYQQAREAVHRLDAQHGRAPDQRSDHLAAALVVAARHEGMHRIDQVLLSEDATRAFAVQGKLDSPLRQLAHVETLQALNTPIAQSSDAWKLAPQPLEPQPQAAQPVPQQAPGMGR